MKCFEPLTMVLLAAALSTLALGDFGFSAGYYTSYQVPGYQKSSLTFVPTTGSVISSYYSGVCSPGNGGPECQGTLSQVLIDITSEVRAGRSVFRLNCSVSVPDWMYGSTCSGGPALMNGGNATGANGTYWPAPFNQSCASTSWWGACSPSEKLYSWGSYLCCPNDHAICDVVQSYTLPPNITATFPNATLLTLEIYQSYNGEWNQAGDSASCTVDWLS